MTFEEQQNNMCWDDYNELMFYKYIDSINNTQYSTQEILEFLSNTSGYCTILDYSNEKDFIDFINSLRIISDINS